MIRLHKHLTGKTSHTTLNTYSHKARTRKDGFHDDISSECFPDVHERRPSLLGRRNRDRTLPDTKNHKWCSGWWNVHYGRRRYGNYRRVDGSCRRRNKELDRKIRIIGEVLDAMNYYDDSWYGRSDSWSHILPLDEGEEEWPLHRVWAHFMLWPLEDEIIQVLQEAEEDFEYEKWINSKQHNKSLEAYNRHKLLAFEKGYAPNWVGEFTEDNVRSENLWAPRAPLYNTYLKERYIVQAVIQTEFPEDRGNKGYAKASAVYGDIYIPYRFKGYIGQPGSPQLMTVALQDVGDGNRKGNGFRFTCIYTH